MARKLGERQKGALRCMARFGSWPGGWVYGSNSQTVEVLDSLVKRGLVKHDPDTGGHYGHYTLTDEGGIEVAARGLNR